MPGIILSNKDPKDNEDQVLFWSVGVNWQGALCANRHLEILVTAIHNRLRKQRRGNVTGLQVGALLRESKAASMVDWKAGYQETKRQGEWQSHSCQSPPLMWLLSWAMMIQTFYRPEKMIQGNPPTSLPWAHLRGYGLTQWGPLCIWKLSEASWILYPWGKALLSPRKLPLLRCQQE